MLAKQLVKEEERPHRDEMNLIEFPIGVIADRVPLDPMTGKEQSEICFERNITESGIVKIQKWIVKGDRELPRGYDLDVFTALMTLLGHRDFQDRLISLGSAYRILRSSGKSDGGEQYQRFRKAIDRLYGVSFKTYNAIYDPAKKCRLAEYEFRFISSYRLKETDDPRAPRGFVRVSEEFHDLLKLGYLKLTDINRYWRLTGTYTRRLFQYLDKHRAWSLRDQSGRFEINGYLLAKKLGTLDQTLQSYRPAKLRDVMGPHLDALKADSYLADYRWKKEGKGRAPVCLEVTYTPNPSREQAPLGEKEAEAIARLGRELGEPESRAYHERVVIELGATRALSILGEVLARAESNRQTHRGKLFTYLAQQARGIRPAARVPARAPRRP